MTPYYQDDAVTIYHGDCREWMPEADVIVTDPPYGIGWDVGSLTDWSRGNARRGALGRAWAPVHGDDEPFDPRPIVALGVPTVLFGGNHFASLLPDSPSWLIWDKRERNGFHTDQADCEMAWTNIGGPARVFRLVASPSGRLEDRYGEGRPHPMAKPIALMRWVVGRCPPGTILDPYMGSGTTLVAAKSLGRPSIGIEIEERYCEIAANRCRQEVLGLA